MQNCKQRSTDKSRNLHDEWRALGRFMLKTDAVLVVIGVALWLAFA